MRTVDVAAGGADVSPSKRARTETAAEGRPVLRFAKLSAHATTPTRGSVKAAGFDLYRLVVLDIFHFLSSRVQVISSTRTARTCSVVPI